MRAIDTNVLVRFLTDDDPKQSPKARAVVAAGDIYVATTVLLEADWVPRSAYGYRATAVTAAFATFAGLPGVTIEDPDLLASALALVGEGLDYADALHLRREQGCKAFVTFDRKLIKAASGPKMAAQRDANGSRRCIGIARSSGNALS